MSIFDLIRFFPWFSGISQTKWSMENFIRRWSDRSCSLEVWKCHQVIILNPVFSPLTLLQSRSTLCSGFRSSSSSCFLSCSTASILSCCLWTSTDTEVSGCWTGCHTKLCPPVTSCDCVTVTYYQHILSHISPAGEYQCYRWCTDASPVDFIVSTC